MNCHEGWLMAAAEIQAYERVAQSLYSDLLLYVDVNTVTEDPSTAPRGRSVSVAERHRSIFRSASIIHSKPSTDGLQSDTSIRPPTPQSTHAAN